VTAILSGCNQATKSNPGFSFYGDQVDIERLPDYTPHGNVLLSIQNLTDEEKAFYISFAEVYQYLHSGNFDYVSAFQESTASSKYDSDVFAVFDFTAPAGKTIDDYLQIIALFYATQSEIYYLDIHEILYDPEKGTITFGMRLTNMHQFAAIVDDLNEAINRTNDYIELFFSEVSGNISSGSSRYDIIKTLYYMLIDKVEYDHSLSAIGGTIAGAVDPDIRSIMCNGYARTIYYYLSRFDVPCLIVMGDSGGDGHAWNYVQLDDGKWYLLDATWDDAGEEISYEHFLVGARATSASHTPWNLSSLENIVLENNNFPMPNAAVFKIDSRLYVGGSFEFPNLNINYNDYLPLVYITDYIVSDLRDIRSVRSENDTYISELFTDSEGHYYTQIPAKMYGFLCGYEFSTSGKYITIILTHNTTGEKTTIIYTVPVV
jgi:hypothetical protein